MNLKYNVKFLISELYKKQNNFPNWDEIREFIDNIWIPEIGVLSEFKWYVHANPQQFLREKWFKAEHLNEIELKHFPKFSFDKTRLYINQMLYDIESKGWNNRIYWFVWYSYYKLWEFNEANKFFRKAIELNDNYFPVEKLNSYMVITYIHYTYNEDIEESLRIIKECKDFLMDSIDDFEVNINFRLKNKIFEIEEKILSKDKIDIYNFTF